MTAQETAFYLRLISCRSMRYEYSKTAVRRSRLQSCFNTMRPFNRQTIEIPGYFGYTFFMRYPVFRVIMCPEKDI